jgi:hypothetical protein
MEAERDWPEESMELVRRAGLDRHVGAGSLCQEAEQSRVYRCPETVVFPVVQGCSIIALHSISIVS